MTEQELVRVLEAEMAEEAKQRQADYEYEEKIWRVLSEAKKQPGAYYPAVDGPWLGRLLDEVARLRERIGPSEEDSPLPVILNVVRRNNV